MAAADPLPPPGASVPPQPAVPPAAVPEPPPEPSLWSTLQALLHELPGLVGDRVRLASLELRRAGIALAQIVALGVVAAILLVTAWLATWVGIGGALITFGLAWGWALVVIIAINVGAAWFAISHARSLLGLLGLPATVRQLTGARSSPPPQPPTPSAAPEPPREQPLAP